MSAYTPLLTSTEAARLVDRSPRRLRQLAQAGVLPAQRLGERGHLRFRRDDVMQLLRPAATPTAEGGR